VANEFWDRAQLTSGFSRYGQGRDHVLDVVDFILHWYPEVKPSDRHSWAKPIDWPSKIAALEQVLDSGRSIWRVNARGDGLERRTRPAITEMARRVTTTAAPKPRDHLQSAWAAVYGRDPNPDFAYSEAIRAVEEVLCPLVQKNAAHGRKSTLGSVLGELRKNQFAKWELLLPGQDGEPRDIAHLLGMVELLWHSQVSRHGGPESRRQLLVEARAAVQIAVILVEWLSAGVLRRKKA